MNVAPKSIGALADLMLNTHASYRTVLTGTGDLTAIRGLMCIDRTQPSGFDGSGLAWWQGMYERRSTE